MFLGCPKIWNGLGCVGCGVLVQNCCGVALQGTTSQEVRSQAGVKGEACEISSNPKQFWMHSFQPEEGLQNVRDCFVLQDVYSLSQPIVLRLLYINNSSLSGLFIPAWEPGCVPF